MSDAHRLLSRACVLVLLVAAPAVCGAQSNDAVIHYKLNVTRSSAHLAEVEIGFLHDGKSSPRFALPAWTPGDYQIHDYARLVQDISARDAANQPVPVGKVDKQTWQINAASPGRISLFYKVYANTLSEVYSQVNDHHASILGASMFMYLVGGNDRPCHLTINQPPSWNVATGLRRIGERTYAAPNYDIFIDAPIEMGNYLERKFTHGSTQYHVVLDYVGVGPDLPAVIDQYVADIQRVVAYQVDMMGGAPPGMDHYYFMFHSGSSEPYGLEHLNSTQIGFPYPLSDASSGDNLLKGIKNVSRYDLAVYLAAHEFFHLWNVKRIRPIALGPFDYAREVHTKDLWICEGLTEYFGLVTMLRSGYWPLERYLEVISSVIEFYENHPAKSVRTLEESSWDTWFRGEHGDDSNWENIWYSYYRKGDILGLLVDLKIVEATEGKRGLHDVFRLMYKRYPYSGPGFPEGSFLSAVNEISARDLTPFFNSYISGKEELDYGVLGSAGLVLDRGSKETGYLGIEVTRGKNDQVVVKNVLPGSPAMKAGIDRGDVIIAADRDALRSDDWERLMSTTQPGQRLQFQTLTRNRLLTATVTLGSSPESSIRLKADREATPAQLERRRQWAVGGRQ